MGRFKFQGSFDVKVKQDFLRGLPTFFLLTFLHLYIYATLEKVKRSDFLWSFQIRQGIIQVDDRKGKGTEDEDEESEAKIKEGKYKDFLTSSTLCGGSLCM